MDERSASAEKGVGRTLCVSLPSRSGGKTRGGVLLQGRIAELGRSVWMGGTVVAGSKGVERSSRGDARDAGRVDMET